MSKQLVTATVFPDIDGVSCAIAYAQYLAATDTENTYIAGFGGGLHAEPRFVCDKLGIKPTILKDEDEFDAFVLVDCSEPKGLPAQVRLDDVIDIVDHRMFADFKAFKNAKFRVEPVGAAATQIAEFFYFNRTVQLSPETAALLLCGIYSNTVNFQADTTTARDHRMRDWLKEMSGPQYYELPNQMFGFKSDYVLKHLSEVLHDDAKDNCDQFNLDSPVVMFQIETMRAEELLDQEATILKEMKSLFPKRSHHLLTIQDAQNARTYLLTDSDDVKKSLLRTNLTLTNKTENTFVTPKIVMRKSVLKAVINANG